MDDADEHTVKEAHGSAMDAKEWSEALQRHREAQAQRSREEKAERSKASTAKARALLQRLKDDEPRMQAELAAIRERRELFGEPETKTTSAPVMNAGQQQVRQMYEQQRPTMDPATQKLWDGWCDARCRNIVAEDGSERFRAMFWSLFADEIGEALGEEIGKLDAEITREMRQTFADVRKEFTAEITKLRRENAKLRKDLVANRSGSTAATSPVFLKKGQ
ncbi:hypothetical protein [Bradyrhizobium sp. URHC0002]